MGKMLGGCLAWASCAALLRISVIRRPQFIIMMAKYCASMALILEGMSCGSQQDRQVITRGAKVFCKYFTDIPSCALHTPQNVWTSGQTCQGTMDQNRLPWLDHLRMRNS